MVATFAQGTCLPNSGWAVVTFTAGAWQLVPNGYHTGFVAAIAAVGSDIRQTVPVWRKSDGPSNPTGGTKSRTHCPYLCAKSEFLRPTVPKRPTSSDFLIELRI
jgi:hypothetical protein